MARLLLAWIVALAFVASPVIASAGSACRDRTAGPMAMMDHGPTSDRGVAPAATPCRHHAMNGCAGSCCDMIVAIACVASSLPKIETRSLIAPLVGLSSPSCPVTGLDPPPKSIA